MTKAKPTSPIWTDPGSLLRASVAAGMAGASPDTMSKRIRNLNSRSANLKAEAVADLYRSHGGTRVLLPAALVYQAIGINPSDLSAGGVELEPPRPPPQPPKGPPRWRPTRQNLDALAAMSVESLRDALTDALGIETGKAPSPARARAIVDALAAKGRPVQGVFKGIRISDIRADSLLRFGSVGPWLAGGSVEPWPFLLPRGGGRPVDLLSASEREIDDGVLCGLDVESYLEAMAAALAAERGIERARVESGEICDAAGPGRGALGAKRL